MPTNHSARLDLPYLAAGQLQKNITVNEALTRLDAIAQTAVVSRTVTDQPADPDDGDLYILAVGATGAAWSAWSAGDLVRAEFGGWTRVPTPIGTLAYILDEDALTARNATGWISVVPSALQNLTRLGLNTEADDTNPFAAKINKALWTALPTAEGGDGDLRFTFNKDGPTDVLSLLFQSGYGGRAELGLIGDDDLSLKVSADGSTWNEALRIDGHEGRVWFPQGAGRAETALVSASGGYKVPDWARLITVVALGGGGGGGTGAFAASGARSGGGGGGGGGLSSTTWRAQDLPGPLSVVIGTGGGAGAAGGDTILTASGITLLTARGGSAGVSGSSGGAAGVGGAGVSGPGNPGGATSTTSTAAAGEALICSAGPGGGGGGGGLDAGATARAGGAGGSGGVLTCPGVGGTGGIGAVGAAGAAPAASVSVSGGGGGGGGGRSTGAAYAGGAGGGYGAGGGGGGAGVSAGGAGGTGSSGVVLILVQG